MAFDFRVAPNTMSYIPLLCLTNPPNVSYIDADGRVSGGSLRIFADQIRSIRIDCVQFGSVTNIDWVSIADAHCSVVAAGCTPSTVPWGLLRIVADHGELWIMDIRFIADTYLQWNVSLNRICMTLAFGEVIIQNLRNSAGDPPMILGMSGQSLPTLPCTSLLLCNGWNKRVIHMLNYNYLVVLNIWRLRTHLNRNMNVFIVSAYEFEEGKEICGGRCDVTHPRLLTDVVYVGRLGLGCAGWWAAGRGRSTHVTFP